MSWIKILKYYVCIWIHGHPFCVFEPKSSITSRCSTDSKSALEEYVNFRKGYF